MKWPREVPYNRLTPSWESKRRKTINHTKQKLLELIKSRAIQHGAFVLKSGQHSQYYLDLKQVTLEAEGLRLISSCMLDIIRYMYCDSIGGMSLGADPIIGGMLATGGWPGLKGFLVRKEPKNHGTQRYIEGQLGESAVIVEDVLTTGSSALFAAEKAREAGCQVGAVVGVIDRLQGAKSHLLNHDLSCQSLFTIKDLGIKTEQ